MSQDKQDVQDVQDVKRLVDALAAWAKKSESGDYLESLADRLIEQLIEDAHEDSADWTIGERQLYDYLYGEFTPVDDSSREAIDRSRALHDALANVFDVFFAKKLLAHIARGNDPRARVKHQQRRLGSHYSITVSPEPPKPERPPLRFAREEEP